MDPGLLIVGGTKPPGDANIRFLPKFSKELHGIEKNSGCNRGHMPGTTLSFTNVLLRENFHNMTTLVILGEPLFSELNFKYFRINSVSDRLQR